MWTSLRRSLPAQYGDRATVFAIACIIFVAGRAPFAGQWDSFDYLKQIVTHRLSDLAFGRPAFIGSNILLWEALKKLLRLEPLRVETVVMVEIILVGALGVLIFGALARRLLPALPARLALLAMLLSPAYALYSGFVMTEVPMLVALIGSAVILWPVRTRHQVLSDAASGVMFGVAVGIREQALTVGAAFVWILWSRRAGIRARFHSLAAFGIASGVVILGPVVALYFHDPAAFASRTNTWLHTIPTGPSHLRRNIQASLIYTFAVCPAAWLATLGAGVHRCLERLKRSVRAGVRFRPTAISSISSPVIGILCCLVLPVAVLWRDADVQIHPRYALVALPAALIFCSSLYSRWLPSVRAAVAWAVVHLVVFAAAQVVIQPFRNIQAEKKEYALEVRRAIPGPGLLVPGGYSPIMDYYRVVGDRPQWQILWSGWGWDRKVAEARIRDAWSSHIPVYLCEGPMGWLYLEDEFLDLFYIFRRSRSDVVTPGLLRMYPAR